MIAAVSGVQGQAKTEKKNNWSDLSPPPFPLPTVHFQYDLTLDPPAESVIWRFTLNWCESSKKPFSRHDGRDGKNYRRQERIFPLFHSIDPRRGEMSVGSPSMWNQTGRLLTKVTSCSHQVRFCFFFFCSCSPRFSPSWWQTVTPTDAYVHTHCTYCEQALTNSAGSLFLLWHHSRLHPAILLLLFFLWQPLYCTGVNWISTLFKLPLYSKLPKRREIQEGFQQLGQQPGCAAIDGGTSMLTLRWINVKHSEG